MILVGVTTSGKVVFSTRTLVRHGHSVIAARDHALCALPITAAMERPRVAPEPVVSDPPAVRFVVRRSVAMSGEIVLCRFVAVIKVQISVESSFISPTRLGHDAAEPALPIAFHGTVQVRGEGTLRFASVLEWNGAVAVIKKMRDGL